MKSLADSHSASVDRFIYRLKLSIGNGIRNSVEYAAAEICRTRGGKSMGDECTCEKCQAGSVNESRAFVWTVARVEAQAEGHGRAQRNLYLVITEGGISLRQQSFEM